MPTTNLAWCPQCKSDTHFMTIRRAAEMLGLHPRTVYRHIEDSSVYAFRIGGKGTYRVCYECLSGNRLLKTKNLL